MSIRYALRLLCVLAPATAFADDDDPELDYEGDYLKGGINLGLTFHGDGAGENERGDGVFYGVEVGWTRIKYISWYGATAEVGRDTAGDNTTRVAIGPKVGVIFLGLDVRYMGELNDGDIEHGFNIRIRGTVGFAGGYLGFSRVGDDFFVDLGGQLKIGPRVRDTD